MKSIALCLFSGLFGNIFITALKQEDADCICRKFFSTCCSDDINRIHNDETIAKMCRVCIKRFGVNCGQICPQGCSTWHCNKTCTCATDQCDDKLKCVTTEKISAFIYKQTTELQIRKPLGMGLLISLSASIFIIILLLGLLLKVVYRLRKNNARYSEADFGRGASTEDISGDSSVIYAAVVRPNRTPVRGVEQTDRMYGNTLRLQKPNQERNKMTNLNTITNNNASNEVMKTGSSATYSFVGDPDKAYSLEQSDQEYGNTTMS